MDVRITYYRSQEFGTSSDRSAGTRGALGTRGEYEIGGLPRHACYDTSSPSSCCGLKYEGEDVCRGPDRAHGHAYPHYAKRPWAEQSRLYGVLRTRTAYSVPMYVCVYTHKVNPCKRSASTFQHWGTPKLATAYTTNIRFRFLFWFCQSGVGNPRSSSTALSHTRGWSR